VWRAARHGWRWLAGAPWVIWSSSRAPTRRRVPAGQGPRDGGTPECPGDERGHGVATAAAVRRGQEGGWPPMGAVRSL
jgi:hypothetical protein